MLTHFKAQKIEFNGVYYPNMDINDVVALAKVIDLNAINTDAGDVASVPPKHIVKFEAGKIVYMITGELAPVTFNDGPFERRLLGVCQPGIFINLHLHKIAHALAAYSVGRVVYFDGKQYPAELPFTLPFPTRSNVVNYIAVYVNGGGNCDQLKDMLVDFFTKYKNAWLINDVFESVVCGADERVKGTPTEFIRMLITTRCTSKYGHVWKIQDFGPSSAEFVRSVLTTGSAGAFIAAIMG